MADYGEGSRRGVLEVLQQLLLAQLEVLGAPLQRHVQGGRGVTPREGYCGNVSAAGAGRSRPYLPHRDYRRCKWTDCMGGPPSAAALRPLPAER